jgi:hypothetical protein
MGYYGKQGGERFRIILKYPVATDRAMKRSGIMILLYGGGGGPGAGEIPMDLFRKQASDVFPVRGVSRTNNALVHSCMETYSCEFLRKEKNAWKTVK